MILHVTSREAWEAARPLGFYEAPSLAAEGFIHCSTGEQLGEVLERHFAGRTGLLLLTIDPARLTSEIRWEDGYPHVYGPIEIEAVTSAQTLST